MGFTSVIENKLALSGEVSGFHYGTGKGRKVQGKKLSALKVSGVREHDDTVELAFSDGSTHIVHIRGQQAKGMRAVVQHVTFPLNEDEDDSWNADARTAPALGATGSDSHSRVEQERQLAYDAQKVKPGYEIAAVTSSILDEALVTNAIMKAIAQLPNLLVEPLLPVSSGGAPWQQAFRVYEHIPCQKGEELILAEHCTTKPRPLEWIPPKAKPSKFHRVSDPPHAPVVGAFSKLKPVRQKAVDEFVLSHRVNVASKGCDLESLAVLLTGRWGDQLEQLRSLFRWVVEHITFDMSSFLRYREQSGPVPNQGAREVMRRRIAVNAGYANLMHAMCRAAGLQSFLVRGNGKGWGVPKYLERLGNPDIVSDHIWIAVYVREGWQFVDPCWAAGTIEWRVGLNAAASVESSDDALTKSNFLFAPDVRYRKRLSEQFWLMSPERAIADHCPEDEAWQLLGEPKSVISYQRAVYCTPSFFDKELKLQSHPDDGTIMCSDRFEVTISHSSLLRGCFCCVLHDYTDRTNRRIGTHCMKYPGEAGSTIVRSGLDSTTFHLRFPAKGDFELKMYCATDRATAADMLLGERPWATAFDLVCCYRFFAHGSGVPRPERYPWAAVGVSLFEPDQSCIYSGEMQNFRLKAHKHGPTIKHMFLQFAGQKYPLAPLLAIGEDGDREGHGWAADIVFPEGSHGTAYIIAERALTAFLDKNTDHYAQLDVLAEFEIRAPGLKVTAKEPSVHKPKPELEPVPPVSAPAPAPAPAPVFAPVPTPAPAPQPPEPEPEPEPQPGPEPEEPIPDLPEPIMPDPVVVNPVPLKKERCYGCHKEVDLADTIFDGTNWWHPHCMPGDADVMCAICGAAVNPDQDIKYRGVWIHKQCFETKCPAPQCMNGPDHGPGMFGRYCVDHQPELTETKLLWLLKIDPAPEPEPEPAPPPRKLQKKVPKAKAIDGLIRIRTTAGAVSRGREKVVRQDITHYKYWLNHRCCICGLLWPLCRHARAGGPLAKEEYTPTRGYFDVDRKSRTLQRGLARASHRLLVTDAQRTAKHYTPDYDKWLAEVRLRVSKQPNRLMTAEPVTTLRSTSAARKKLTDLRTTRSYTGPVGGRPHPWNMPVNQRNDIVAVPTAARNHPWDSRVQVPVRKSVQIYLHRVGLGACYKTFEEHLPTRIKSVELIRATSAADLRQMGKRIGAGRSRSLASLIGRSDNADDIKRYEYLDSVATAANQHLCVSMLAMQRATSHDIDSTKRAVDEARRSCHIAEKERRDCLTKMDNLTIRHILQALKQQPTDVELMRVPAWAAPVKPVETRSSGAQYVVEFVTSEGSRVPTADVYCQVRGDEVVSKTIRCANVGWVHFSAGAVSPFRFSEEHQLGDVEQIVVQHTPLVAGESWALFGVVVTCERTSRRWSAAAHDAKFDRDHPSRTFQATPVPDGKMPLPSVISAGESNVPLVGYAVHLRVRVVSEFETEVPLSVVVRGEAGEHSVLVEVQHSENNLEAIHVEATFECNDLGKFIAIEIGDWAGVCGEDQAPVQVFVEHADLERSDATHNHISARNRCHCYQWLPRRETLRLRGEDQDPRVIMKAHSTENIAPRAWVLRLVTGDDRVARALHTPKWKREPPTVTIILTCDGVAVDFPLVGLKYTPYVGEQFVCLVIPDSFDLRRTVLSICADDRRPGGLSVPFEWNISRVQILGAEGRSEKKMKVWHAECGFTLNCHNSSTRRVIRPTCVDDIACYAVRVTARAGRSGMPAAPVFAIAMGSAESRVSLHALISPGCEMASGCQLVALPQWLPKQTAVEHLENRLDVGVQSHCATGMLVDGIEVTYNGKTIAPFRFSRELLRSDGMQAVNMRQSTTVEGSAESTSLGSEELLPAPKIAAAKGTTAPTPHKVFLRFSKSRMVRSIFCQLGFRCETEEGSDLIWSQRIEMCQRAGYFAAHGEYEFPITLSDPDLLERPERVLTTVRLFVAADEWIVECVGVVAVQSGEAFAAVFAPVVAEDVAETRVANGGAEDEAKALDVRQQRSNVRERAMAVEVARAETALAKMEESRAETAQINAGRLHAQIEREVAELEAELQERKNEAARSRARWRSAASLAKASRKRSRSPDPWEKATELVNAWAAAAQGMFPTETATQRKGVVTDAVTFADMTAQERMEAQARARWRSARIIDSDLALAVLAPRPWEDSDSLSITEDMREVAWDALTEPELWKLAEEAAADRMRGVRDYSGQRKAFSRPWVDYAKDLLTEWCITVGGSLQEALSCRADRELKALRSDVLRLLAALKEHKGVEVTWEEVADEISAEQLLVVIAQQINPDDVDRYIRFVLTPLAEVQRHGWYEPPGLARLASLRLKDATEALKAAQICMEKKVLAHRSAANKAVFAEHAQLGAEADLRAAVGRFESSGGLLHREVRLTSQGKIESEVQRLQRRPVRVEELAASAELSWWQNHRQKSLKAWQKSIEHPPTAENLDGSLELLPWDKTMLRSKPGLAIEKKRREAEQLAARDEELLSKGLYFDRKRGIYTTQHLA